MKFRCSDFNVRVVEFLPHSDIREICKSPFSCSCSNHVDCRM